MTPTRQIAPAEAAQELRAGSLFSGAGWLDLAIEQVFRARTVWVSDIEPGPCKVLAHRFPGVPNLGDITKIDWSTVAAVDIIGGGSPCQDISSAGRMAGMVAGTRSNLWVQMREAIRIIQPMFVVWENVGAARSTKAASRFHPEHIDRAIAHHLAVAKGTRHAPTKQRHRKAARRLMESRARRLGVPYPKPSLRALGRVLGDLADLGFDAEFIALRAADVGAPHGRLRYFVLAANARGQARLQRAGLRAGRTAGVGRGRPHHDHRQTEPVALLPTPTTQDGANQAGASQHRRDTPPLNVIATLLPTPMVGSSSPAAHGQISGDRGDELLLKGIAAEQAWGPYEPAIRRWESIVGPAPTPTKPGKKGRPKLNPEFACWLMGAEPGWVTDVPGVTDNEALRMAGNGVVQQQAVAALELMVRRMIEHLTEAAA